MAGFQVSISGRFWVSTEAVSGLSAERATVAVLGMAYALADSPLATGRDR